jgi:hypothetical protein
VTGNSNKLREVQEILSHGGNPISIESQSLESVFPTPSSFGDSCTDLRDVQFQSFRGQRSKSRQQNVGGQPSSSGDLVSRKTLRFAMRP